MEHSNAWSGCFFFQLQHVVPFLHADFCVPFRGRKKNLNHALENSQWASRTFSHKGGGGNGTLAHCYDKGSPELRSYLLTCGSIVVSYDGLMSFPCLMLIEYFSFCHCSWTLPDWLTKVRKMAFVPLYTYIIWWHMLYMLVSTWCSSHYYTWPMHYIIIIIILL